MLDIINTLFEITVNFFYTLWVVGWGVWGL